MLYRLQVIKLNKALLICFRSNRDDSYYFNHLKAKVLPLHIRRKCSILRLMYSRVNKVEMPENQNQQNPRLTRVSDLPHLVCIFTRSEAFKKSISFTGPRYWEILPGRLKIIPDLKSSRMRLRNITVIYSLRRVLFETPHFLLYYLL